MHQQLANEILDLPHPTPRETDTAPSTVAPPQELTVHVSAESHRAFFAGTPKLVVAAHDAMRWRSVPTPADVEVFRFGLDDQGIGRVGRPDAPSEEASCGLAVPPSQCLGLIALSTEGKRELDALFEWWSAQTPGEIPAPILLDQDADPACALSRFLADRLLRDVVVASRSIVSLRRDLAELREEHEATQTVLTLLGQAVARCQVPPLSCVLVLHPGSNAVGPSREGEPFVLRQRLPIPSQGLAAIALHVVRGPATAEGRLIVTLNARESGVNLVTWAIPYDQTNTGWNFLEIPSVITGPKQTVEMLLRWDGPLAGAPMISISQQSIGEGGQLTTQSGRRIRYAVAMQLWTGVPGSRLSASAFARSGEAVPGPGEGRDLFLSTARMAQAKLLQPQRVDLGFSILAVDQPGSIQLHPVAGTPLSHAVIPAACPPGIRRLVAAVRTANPEAPLVEYAMMLTPVGHAQPFPSESGPPLPAGAIVSPWLAMPPDTKGSVVIALDRPNEQPCDLHIATRVPAGSSDNFAWARWLGFHIQLA